MNTSPSIRHRFDVEIRRGLFVEISSILKGESTWIFGTEKLHRKKCVETRWIFRPSKYVKRGTWKRREFFDQRNYIEKVQGNDVEIRRNLAFDVWM